MGARRLATPALDLRKRRDVTGQTPPLHHTRDQQMENAGQPATHAFRTRDVSDTCRWMADVPAVALVVDEIYPVYNFDPGPSPVSGGPEPPPRWNLETQPFPECLG